MDSSVVIIYSLRLPLIDRHTCFMLSSLLCSNRQTHLLYAFQFALLSYLLDVVSLSWLQPGLIASCVFDESVPVSVGRGLQLHFIFKLRSISLPLIDALHCLMSLPSIVLSNDYRCPPSPGILFWVHRNSFPFISSSKQ